MLQMKESMFRDGKGYPYLFGVFGAYEQRHVGEKKRLLNLLNMLLCLANKSKANASGSKMVPKA